jgi:hypothetical protein
MSAVNASTRCPYANIWSSGNTCGTQCDAFCIINLAVCSGANAAYTSMSDCAAKCAGYAPGHQGDSSGDTLACREYFVGVASRSPGDATLQCPHTSQTSSTCH